MCFCCWGVFPVLTLYSPRSIVWGLFFSSSLSSCLLYFLQKIPAFHCWLYSVWLCMWQINLPWPLTLEHRIDFKILLITYKALNGLAPQYLSEILSHYSPPRPLRSQNSGHLIIPRISKSTAGGRSFSYLAPKLWNNLPNTVREADTLCQFKSRLKTHLFNLAYTYHTNTLLIFKSVEGLLGCIN